MSRSSNRLTHRTLRAPTDLSAFATEYTSRSGHGSDLAYLSQAQVRGFYVDGALVAGYAVAVAEHRYLAAIPAGTCTLPVDDCVEGTHIWIDRSLSVPARARIYGRLLFDVLRTGRRYALGGATVLKLVNIQRLGTPHMIYEGPVLIDGVEQHGWVYYGTRWTIMRGFMLASRRLLGRRATGPTKAPRST